MPLPIKTDGLSLSNLFSSNETNSDNLLIEKQNLLCILKLVIKDLLDSSLNNARLLENEYFPLKHFFIVFEHILFHGYNGKKTFPISSSSNRKDLWPIIDLITKKSTDINVSEIFTSSKEMTHVRTSLGRVRAWLRLALMQKRLADYFKILIEQKDALKDFYDKDALLLSEESAIVTGLLVGLNVLDFNLCLKESVLDDPVESVIHYNLYLRERRLRIKSMHSSNEIECSNDEFENDVSSSIRKDDEIHADNVSLEHSIDRISTEGNRNLASILDQKHYLEEINRNLQQSVNQIQERLQTAERKNKVLLDETTEQKHQITKLEENVEKLTIENERIQAIYQRKIDIMTGDIEAERETYNKSRNGFDSIFNELQKKYDDERLSKQKFEQNYQSQLSQNTEYIESTRNMEKDIEIKTALYDRIKQENNFLENRLQNERTRCEQKENQICLLEKENQMLRTTINDLEKNIEKINKDLQEVGNRNESLTVKLEKSSEEKSLLETDLRLERDSYQRLQTALSNEKGKIASMQFDIHELKLIKDEYDKYKVEMTQQKLDFENKIQEQDECIGELALKLETSIKRQDEIRELGDRRLSNSSSLWMNDESVKKCCLCNKDFNTLRRKHHCRHCGKIFCESCTTVKLPLPGTNKPVRTCDTCCKQILAQCAVNN